MIRTTILASLFLSGALWGQTVPPTEAQPAAPAGKSPAPAPASRFRPARFSKRAELHYGLVWGVDSLSVKYTESGEVIRFAYRVLDGDKAMQLNDKRAEPALISPEKGVKLVIPALENIGLLRQTPSGKPEPGKIYWMAFSNKGRMVKRGDRVNVVIGQFRAEGLVVE